MARFFTLKELCASDTAQLFGIDNFPSFEVAAHLEELVETILDPLRAAYGKPIKVNSGYRSDKLNKRVGGVSTSAHIRGYAADIRPVRGDFDKFGEFVVNWLKRSGAKFDQCLLEESGGAKWIHIALYNTKGSQRGEIRLMKV